MTTQLVHIGFGKTSYKTTSGSWLAAVVTAPFIRQGVSQVFRKANVTSVRFPASTHPQINGFMHSDRFELPDGTLILLQAQHRSRGSPVRDGAILVRTRKDGPRLNIMAATVPAVESILSQNFLVFEGAADVLNEEEMQTFGLEVPAFYKNNYFRSVEVAECFTVMSYQAPGTTKVKPQVRTVTLPGGEVKKILVTPPPARKIRIRRGES